MKDIKRKYGLTNSEIAQGIDDLSDDDFYDVIQELASLHSIDIRTESFGNWIDLVLNEIESK